MSARGAWTQRVQRVSKRRQLGASAGNASQQALVLQSQVYGLATPVLEHRFAPPRRWRFDLAFVAQKLAVEIDGGVWTQGRHTRGTGYVKDCEKFAHAAILGWRVMRVVPQQVKNGQAIRWIEAALTGRAQEPSV